MEIYKDIPTHEGLYQASNLGNIRSLDRVVKGKRSTQILKGICLKLNKHQDGGMQVMLSINGKPKVKKVHRLAASAFLPNPNNYKVINHKNGVRSDNRVENLEWCTQSYNMQHSYDVLNREIRKGKDSVFSKLSEDEALFVLTFNHLFSRRKLAEMLNVSKSTVSAIVWGESWSHLTTN